MELRHLRYFQAVADEKHFGRAAHKLHMAQPPLSQQIKQLEDELGVTLLQRTTRRVDLTPAGEAYLVRVRAILQAVEAAGDEAVRIGNGLEGRLVIGCVGSATYSLLPALARSLREQLPNVDFAFRGEMLSPEQLDALRDGSIDLALLRHFADLTQSTDVTLTALREERYVVALPEGHRLAGRSRVRVADLEGEDLIVHSGHGRSAMFDAVTTLCRDAGFEPSVRHEVAETSTLVTFVAAALGVAVVPEPVSELVVAGTVYRPLATRARMELVAATRADDRSALLARTLAVLAEQVRSWLPSAAGLEAICPRDIDLVVGSGAVADRVVASPCPSPRPVERGPLLELLETAWGWDPRVRDRSHRGAAAATVADGDDEAGRVEVAALIAEGLSNRLIADRLVISHRTVDGHVERILAKPELTSRTQVATWAVARQASPGQRSV